MCGTIVDIQSPTAEIRRGKKEEETTAWKYIWPALLHRAAINYCMQPALQFLHAIIAGFQTC